MPNQVWYSFFGGELKDDSTWFDTNDFGWAGYIEKNSETITKELRGFISKNENKLAPYFNKDLISAPGSWKALSFKFWNYPLRQNLSQIPETVKLLHAVPHLVSASVSLLEPRSQIKPHRGDTNAIIRCHLPITIPNPLPLCGMQVGESAKSWEEGKLLLFCDAARHFAWNNSNERRFILILDIIRPEFAKQEKKICAGILSSLLWQYFTQRIKLLKRSPRWLKYSCHAFFRILVRIVLVFRS